MRLLRLDVRDFRCIPTARIDFGPGLTVLHGPNELGKSTLVEAIRAALLVPTSSREGDGYVPWGSSVPACVTLTFAHGGNAWRVTKRFGHQRHATLESSNSVDEPRYRPEASGNGVEGRLRELLAWGIAPPAGRGAPTKPTSFLATALLGRQGEAQSVFEIGLDGDRDEAGRALVMQAIGALDKDPAVARIIERLRERVDAVFTPTGRFKTSTDSSLVVLQEHLKAQERLLLELQESDRSGQHIERDVVRLQDEHRRCQEAVQLAEAAWETAKTGAERARQKEQVEAEIADLRRQLSQVDALVSQLAGIQAERDAQFAHAERVRTEESEAAGTLEATRHLLQAAGERVAREAEAASQAGRLGEAARGQRRAELDGRKAALEAELNSIRAVEQAVSERSALERELAGARETAAGASAAVTEAARAFASAELREQIERLAMRLAAFERATARHIDAQHRERDALGQLRSASAAVADAENRLGARPPESATDEMRAAEAELSVLLAVDGQVGVLALRDQIRIAEEAAARATASRVGALSKRTEASRLEQQVASRALPTKEQVAAWRGLQAQLASASPPSPSAPSAAFPLVASLAAGVAGALLARFGAGWPWPGAVFVGLAIAVVVAGAWWLRARTQNRPHPLDSERQRLRHDRWAMEVEPSLRAAGVAGLGDYEAAVAHVDALKTDAQRLRAEGDQDDRAAVEAERAAVPLETLREKLASLVSEAPQADAGAVSARLEAFGTDLEAVRRLIADAQHSVQMSRDRLREMAEATLRSAIEEQDRRQADYEAALKSLAAAETTLEIDREQVDPQALEQYKARLAALGTTVALLTIEDASRALDVAKNDDSASSARMHALSQRLEAAQPEVARLLDTIGGSVQTARERTSQAFEELQAEVQALDAPVTDVSSPPAALEHAKREHERLTEQLDRARATSDSVKAKQTEIDRVVSSLETEIASRQGQLKAIDRAALDSRLQILAGSPIFDSPDGAVADPGAAEAALRRMREQFDRCTGDLNQARGQLHLIAGHVGAERLAQQEEVVTLLRGEVLEQELSEKAARRLLQEIESVEESRATHLGRALAGPVTETFKALTGGRYGRVGLDSNLKTEHIEAQGGAREVRLLSFGTREQLATLIRLAIASHLKTAVVLDDQLVHSDTERLAWFCDQLRASAHEHQHQVIVLTCRPGDYLRAPGVHESVTVIDLQASMSR